MFVSGLKSYAQQQYFIYLQADDHSPFYVKISDKVYSSSESGYMIIPKLGDSSFDIIIGFAKNAFPEQRFPIGIDKKDRGFQLKNTGDKGWVLINLQTTAVIQNTAQAKKIESAFSGAKKTDAFSELLANVVNDSAVLYTPVKATAAVVVEPEKPVVVVKEPEKQIPDTESVTKTTVPIVKTENNLPIEKKDSVKFATIPENTAIGIRKDSSTLADTRANLPVVTSEKTKPAKPDLIAKTVVEKPFITRIEEKKTGGSYEATYLELYSLTTDTIRISIPLNDSVAISLPEPPVKSPDTAVAEQKILPGEKSTAMSSTPDTAVSAKKVLVITNSDCKNFATEYDVDKFRIKLLDDKTIDTKLSSAKKFFRSKCYSVSQVKALSELFPSDETKYQFFELAYPYVSDTTNFQALEEMIQNNLYKNKFKTMIRL